MIKLNITIDENGNEIVTRPAYDEEDIKRGMELYEKIHEHLVKSIPMSREEFIKAAQQGKI